MQAFFFFVGLPQMVVIVPALLVETVETGDKNSDDFRCIQMSLVVSMRFIFVDDWNYACKLSTFWAMM